MVLNTGVKNEMIFGKQGHLMKQVVYKVVLYLHVFGCSTPVSYTHLDVYKRQIANMASIKVSQFHIACFL